MRRAALLPRSITSFEQRVMGTLLTSSPIASAMSFADELCHELVRSHSDAAMDLPRRYWAPGCCEGARPSVDVRVV